MPKFLQLLASLLPEIESQETRDQQYLAEAVDPCDLERRQHDIDERDHHPTALLTADWVDR